MRGTSYGIDPGIRPMLQLHMSSLA